MIMLIQKAECHDINCHLARFSLEGLALRGRILTDDSVVMSLILVNCLLDDMRKNREGMLNRLIERTHNLEASNITSQNNVLSPILKSMIDVTFQQKASDTFVWEVVGKSTTESN